jgi:coat protein Gp5
MNPLYLSLAAVCAFANDNDAFIPEIWAQEGLVILEENMVAAKLVHRDFQDEIKDFGDVVNTRRPGTFKIKRKKDGTTLSQQDANATNVRVPLDQWFYDSFTIKDGEASKSFQELVNVYLLPAMQTIARGVDRAVLGQIHQFLGAPADRVGRLGALSNANAKQYALEARERLNVNKAYQTDRNLILSPSSETAFLNTSDFTKANERGDGGIAIENALLGRILGFDTYMDQNVNTLASGADTDAALVITSALAAGSGGSQSCSGGATVTVGEFLVVAGNDQPTYITAETGTPATAVTLNEVNKYATGASAATVRYKAAAVNLVAGYAAGWSEDINVDGYTSAKAPQAGQLIAFGTGASRRTYTIIEATDNGTDCDILLDRPLEVALTNNQAAFPGPYGSFNWAMHREALALVTRPLALPNERMGVMADVATHNDVSMRVTMQYDINAGGTVVNLDILGGVALLDSRLCVPLLG